MVPEQRTIVGQSASLVRPVVVDGETVGLSPSGPALPQSRN